MTFDEMIAGSRRPQERRERIAAAALSSVLAGGASRTFNPREATKIAATAVQLADALIAELDKPVKE